MDSTRLLALLCNSSGLFRQEDDVVQKENVGDFQITTFNLMPHTSEAKEHIELIDLHLVAVGIDKVAAEKDDQQVKEVLKDIPEKLMRSGPSYIHLGAVLGDQGLALQLMGYGITRGWWRLFGPNEFKISKRSEAEELARNGFLYIIPTNEFLHELYGERGPYDHSV